MVTQQSIYPLLSHPLAPLLTTHRHISSILSPKAHSETVGILFHLQKFYNLGWGASSVSRIVCVQNLCTHIEAGLSVHFWKPRARESETSKSQAFTGQPASSKWWFLCLEVTRVSIRHTFVHLLITRNQGLALDWASAEVIQRQHPETILHLWEQKWQEEWEEDLGVGGGSKETEESVLDP